MFPGIFQPPKNLILPTSCGSWDAIVEWDDPPRSGFSVTRNYFPYFKEKYENSKCNMFP